MSPPWAVVSHGSEAAGEVALAAAFIGAAVARGHRVRAWTWADRHAAHLAQAGAEVEPLGSPAAIEAARPAVVACATSMTCGLLLPYLGALGPPLVTLESSWMPWATRSPELLSPVRRFLLSMPPRVYAAGLGENRGRFAVPAEIRDRVRPLGWFAPTMRRPEGTPPTVLAYFGRGYDPATFPCRVSLGTALEQVARRRPDVRWRYLGQPGLPLPECVEQHASWMDESTFARWHAEADVVICHHGQVTIGRAAAAGSRVLAIAPGTVFRPGADADWSDFEVHAFARAGTVEAVHGPAPAAALARRIEALLDAGRAAPDGGGGAAAAVREVEGLLKSAR